jgi:predicted RNA binding protein YcfA (HicA-like mRNA interferase family)
MVVAVHGNRDIPKGLFHSMIKQAKLDNKDFEK